MFGVFGSINTSASIYSVSGVASPILAIVFGAIVVICIYLLYILVLGRGDVIIEWKAASQQCGTFLAVGGSTLSIIGALINNLVLSHTDAMLVWMISNPMFLAYFVGVDMKWWNGQHISTRALIVTYTIFSASNLWGLFHVV